MRKPRKLKHKNIKIEKWHDCDAVFIETKDRAFIELDRDDIACVAMKLMEWAVYFNTPDITLKPRRRG